MFNGKVNTSIPLINYEFEGIPFPITLNYSGGNGIKADEVPTWVGLGWNLQAGGFVHRTVRGKPDETLDFTTKFYQTTRIAYNDTRWFTETTLNPIDYSYFSNNNKLNNVNWSSASYINTLLPTHSNYSFPFPYNDGTLSGNLTVMNQYPTYDLVPDEFTFSVGRISGKFYLNHENKWIVKSDDGRQYDVQVFTGSDNIDSYYSVPKIIKYLILTSSDGVKYYFGRENATSFSNRLYEYSRSSYSNPLPGAPDNFIQWFTGPFLEIVPHTWYLSKVENLKTGSIVTFDYSNPGTQFYKNRQAWGSGGTYVYKNDQVSFDAFDPIHNYSRASAVTKIATQFFVLSSINFPNGVKIKFESSSSNQMSTDESIGSSDGTGFIHDPDFLSANYSNNHLYKLDKIKLTNNDIAIKQFEFIYTGNDPTHRLKISSLHELSTSGSVGGKYDFEYDQNVLPVYAWGETDHWGYYNHKDFFLSVAPPYDATNLANFTNYKEPDYTYVQSEILKKITSPTGGITEFIYEPNTYSKKRDPNNYTISSLGSNPSGGGVRIQKIKYYSGPLTLEYEKEYDYSISGGSSLSSGVLSSPPPTYLYGTFLKSEGFNPTYYNGNPVTYTNATEKIAGNGSVNYVFSNYDNGQNDGLPLLVNSIPLVTGFEYLYKNGSFKRGKPKSIIVKNETGTALTETDYQYDHDFSESAKSEVRSIYNGLELWLIKFIMII